MGKTQGTYADVIFSIASNKILDKIIKEFGLEKDFKDAYHCTLTYSKKKVPYLKTSKGTSQDRTGNAKDKITKIVKIKSFGHFDTDEGKNLHVVLDSDWCKAQFTRAIKAGATTDYPEYTPHITLMYNCGTEFKLDDKLVKKFIGTSLEMVEERISPLNLDWVEESKLDTDDGEKDLVSQKKDYDCGVATTATILEKFDKHSKEYLELQKELKTKTKTGTTPDDIAKVLKKYKIVSSRLLKYQDSIKGYVLLNTELIYKEEKPKDGQNGHWSYFEIKKDKVMLFDVYTERQHHYTFDELLSFTKDVQIKNTKYNKLIYKVESK